MARVLTAGAEEGSTLAMSDIFQLNISGTGSMQGPRVVDVRNYNQFLRYGTPPRTGDYMYVVEVNASGGYDYFALNSMGEWIKAKLDVTVGSRNAIAPLDAAGTRTALGMASNNLDTQLGALAPAATALDNTIWTNTKAGYLDGSILGVPALVWASVTRTLTAFSDSSGITTLLSRIASALTITGGKVDVNDKTGFSLTTSPLDAAGTRAAIGMAAANLDTQIAAIGSISPADIRNAIGMAAANLDTQLAGIPAADDVVLTAAHGVGSWQASAPVDAGAIAAAVDAVMTASHGIGSWQRITGVAPNTVTYILEAEGNPVSGGQVWVYTDLACTNLVAYGITDTFGQIAFYLAAGTYYVKRAKDTSILFTPTVITMVVT